MTNENILNEVDRRFTDQREFFNAKFTHLSAIMQNGFELASKERVEIISRQDLTNGRVNRLEDNTKLLSKPNRKYLLFGFLIAVFVIATSASWAYYHVNYKETIANKTKIEFKDDTIK